MTVSSPYVVDTTLIQAGQGPQSISDADIRVLNDSLAGLAFSTQTSAYTLTLPDYGTLIEMNLTSAANLTVPANASVAYDIGTRIYVRQAGAGRVTMVGASGVTITPKTGCVAATLTTGSVALLRKVNTNTWELDGDLWRSFQCINGTVYDPNGEAWIERGINLADWGLFNASGGSGGTDSGALLGSLFPGINCIRLNCLGTSPLTQSNGNDDPVQFAPAIAICTALRIVVMVENHDTTATVYTGGTLTQESAWYASWAAIYVNNPYVWFISMNEPQAPATLQAEVTLQHVATYNAIRGTGNNNPIGFDLIGGYTTNQGGTGGSLTASSYTTMNNVFWDFHFYPWLATGGTTPYSSNYALQASTFLTTVNTTKAFTTSANGIMPVFVGEFGISTVGATYDPGGTQAVLAVINSGYGGAAWTWFAGASDRISNGSSVLTPSYGTFIAAWIAGANVNGPVLGTTPYGQQFGNPINLDPSSTSTLVIAGQPSVGAFLNGPYQEVAISLYNQTTAGTFASTWKFSVTRAGSGAVIATSAPYAVIGTAGTMVFGTGATINLSWTAIAADGSGYTLSIQNTSATVSFSIYVSLVPYSLGP